MTDPGRHMPQQVRVWHPDLQQAANAPDSAMPILRRAGWILHSERDDLPEQVLDTLHPERAAADDGGGEETGKQDSGATKSGTGRAAAAGPAQTKGAGSQKAAGDKPAASS